MKDIYIDCTHGISGDMTLAALTHLGVDFTPLPPLLSAAGVDCTLTHWQEERTGGPGMRVEVEWKAEAQPLRHPADIAAIFLRVAVSDRVRERALAVLDALSAAEAHAHQIPVDEVHFHEVGAVDTLVDILGVCWGLEQLGCTRVTASPLPWFGGSIECAHGRIPLPAPATAWLMQGKPVTPTTATTELVTPTGAALVHTLVDAFEAPCGRLGRMGTGYGSRPAPAGLRVWEVFADQASARGGGRAQEVGGKEEVCQLECHLDHLSGEELGMALEALVAAPAVLDALWLPGVGKKNRPSGALRVLCAPEHEEAVAALILRHTHTLGLRRALLQRYVLPRAQTVCPLAGEEVPAKVYTLEGQDYVRPEADAVRACAARLGVGAPALRLARDTVVKSRD